MNSVENTYTSEMQIYEAHLGFHKFKMEQLLFCSEPPLLLFINLCICVFLCLTVHIQSESSFLRTFYDLWYISFPQSCFWKKSSGFRPCLAGSMVSFCQTAILTFSDVCLGEDMLGRTVAICQTFDLRNRKELQRIWKLFVRVSLDKFPIWQFRSNWSVRWASHWTCAWTRKEFSKCFKNLVWEKASMLCKQCSEITRTLWCYQHCFCHKSKNSTTWVTEENSLCLSQIKYEFLRSYTTEIWKWGIIQNLVLMCGTKSLLLLWIMDGQVVGSV